MDYISMYTIRCEDKIKAWFAKTKMDINRYSEMLEGGSSSQWYAHEKDIADAMIETGTASVDLHGVGEKIGDIWDKEFRLVDGSVEVKMFRYDLVRRVDPEKIFQIESYRIRSIRS